MQNTEVLSASEAVYEGCQEQPLDLDLSLPDYCADIQRILKCAVEPCVAACSVNGDRLEVEGNWTLRVYYLDPTGASLRCYDTQGPFVSAVALKAPVQSPRVYAYTKLEYVNCRPTSPRRLAVHGAFSVCARVYGQTEMEVVSSLSGEGLEQQCRTLAYNGCSGYSQEPFTVEETLELSPGKPPAESILRSQAVAVLKSVEPMQGQLMVVGELRLHLTYAGPEPDVPPEAMAYSLPFTQLLDCEGVGEGSQCCVQLQVASVEIQIRADFNGDSSAFDAQLRLLATVTAYTPCELHLLEDAYARHGTLALARKQKMLESLQQHLEDVCSHRFTVEAEGGISRVLDLWAQPGPVTAEVEQGALHFAGKLNLCVLALNAEGKPFCLERSTDFAATRPLNAASGQDLPADAQRHCVAACSLMDLSYRLAGAEKIELEAQLALQAQLFCLLPCRPVTEVQQDPDAAPEEADPAALCLYYAKAGERLWDIARSYRSSMDAIRDENELEGDSVPAGGMLLIPLE